MGLVGCSGLYKSYILDFYKSYILGFYKSYILGSGKDPFIGSLRLLVDSSSWQLSG